MSLVDPFGLCGQDPNEINWWSLGAHFLLGIGGMAPGIGFAFDLADAALCYYEKDYLGMSLAFASAAPAVGLAVGASRVGKRALTIGGYVADMIKNSNRIRQAADMIATATSNARKLIHAGVTDVITAIVSKGDDAAKLLRKGGEGFEEVRGMIRHQGEEIYTTVKSVANANRAKNFDYKLILPLDLQMFADNNSSRVVKTLKEWLVGCDDLLEEASKWYKNKPEWWSIDPDTTDVFYRNQDEVNVIRAKKGEQGGHHPHGLALGGPEGQKLTITNETRKVKNKTHSQVTSLQRKIIRIIKNKMK